MAARGTRVICGCAALGLPAATIRRFRCPRANGRRSLPHKSDWPDPAASVHHGSACPTRITRCHKARGSDIRSEEHTSELQSLMRISYAVFCLKKHNNENIKSNHQTLVIYETHHFYIEQSRYK